jgi:predicted amidohydrolase
MKLKIAVVQFEISQYSPTENLKKAEKFIIEASNKEAQVIVFPEDFVTGPIAGEKNYVDFEEKYKKLFQKWAKQYSIDIVTGSFIEGQKDKWFNTSYYINAQGKIKAQYKKINLWHPERRYLAAGNQVVTFQTKYGKAGLIICWDLMFPEVFRAMVKKGVKIVYCPSYWTAEDAGVGLKYNNNSEIELVNSLSVARAFENEIVFVYANAAGKYDIKGHKGALIGQSQITVPFKGVLKRLSNNKEEMFIQEIDMDIINDAERAYKIRKDLKR